MSSRGFPMPKSTPSDAIARERMRGRIRARDLATHSSNKSERVRRRETQKVSAASAIRRRVKGAWKQVALYLNGRTNAFYSHPTHIHPFAAGGISMTRFGGCYLHLVLFAFQSRGTVPRFSRRWKKPRYFIWDPFASSFILLVENSNDLECHT